MRSKKMSVYYADGRVANVTLTPRAQVMTERHFGASLLELKTVEQAYYMAWAALTSQGLETHDFEEFLNLVDDVEVDEGPMVRPTEQAQ